MLFVRTAARKSPVLSFGWVVGHTDVEGGIWFVAGETVRIRASIEFWPFLG
jgi:hypothetical protein